MILELWGWGPVPALRAEVVSVYQPVANSISHWYSVYKERLLVWSTPPNSTVAVVVAVAEDVAAFEGVVVAVVIAVVVPESDDFLYRSYRSV